MTVTHTPTQRITSTGFIPDADTRNNDERYRQMQARILAKREQTLDLLMLLSALESAFFASKATLPDYLIERIDTAVDALKKELMGDDEK